MLKWKIKLRVASEKVDQPRARRPPDAAARTPEMNSPAGPSR
jgi:hypothetical protein